uniref:EGF-like domain-containing protein n=1 Tax=Bursaphelenchus xylophilus TaxID=6326 RepID=A0A1I7SB39_BURXY
MISVVQTHLGEKKLKPIPVSYKCWCKEGFHGDLCEYTEEMRECVENHCNGHGILTFEDFETTKCGDCVCEQNYMGEHCELVSPCKDIDCTNEATCELDAKGEAECKCPAELFRYEEFKISGEHCEIFDTISPPPCKPCEQGLTSFIECLAELGNFLPSDLGPWTSEYLKNGGDPADLKDKNCFNGGVCNVIVERLPLMPGSATEQLANTLFAVPKCDCPPEFEGQFCERRRKGECEKLSEEERCAHGVCVFTKAYGIQCICDEGYEGQRCERRNKCNPSPCGDALCTEVTLRDVSEEKIPICVCNDNQEVDGKGLKCSQPHFQQCRFKNGTHKCANNAACYPCSFDDEIDALFDICTPDEDARGFRCVCPPGLAKPFCDRPVTPCDVDVCQNGGICELSRNSPSGYTCSCPTSFTGLNCETFVSICSRVDNKCVEGSCVEDAAHHRGYRCDCHHGFLGRNCDRTYGANIIDLFHVRAGRVISEVLDSF